MPGCNGRRYRRRAQMGLLALSLVAAVVSRQARADDNGRGIGDLLGIPRMVREPQVGELDQPATPPTARSRAEEASKAARGRAALEQRVKIVQKPSSSRASRKAAIEGLPLERMSDEHRRRVLQIVNGSSIFRELPALQFEIDPRVYHFFMEHPEVAVSIWRVMKISEFQMHETGPSSYESNDMEGTRGLIDVAYRGPNEVVVLCNGSYKSALLPTAVQANGVLHVEVVFERRPDGKVVATHRAQLFVFFPSQTIETVARLMSPVSNAIIDQNFREVSLFLHMMSTAMSHQPGWVEAVSNRMENVSLDRKAQLMETTIDVFADANPRPPHAASRTSSARD